jgi:hypothetical protein
MKTNKIDANEIDTNEIDTTTMSKEELYILLTNTNKKIYYIDNPPSNNVISCICYCFNYYFNYYFYPDETRSQLVKHAIDIETEILFREDDEKRAKYELQRQKDPLKYGKYKRHK